MDDNYNDSTPVDENGAKDANFMSKDLQQMLEVAEKTLEKEKDPKEFSKVLKYTQSKMTKGQKSSMFYAIITAYCLLKVGKQQDAIDILNEYKQIKASDTQTAMYQASVFTGLGRYSDSTALLEYILNIFPSKKSLQEELFYSYVREGKLLKQQNQALTMYKNSQLEIYA